MVEYICLNWRNIMIGKCGACYEFKEVNYCSFCKTDLCVDCKNNPPKRFIAAVKKRLGIDK